MWPHRWPMRRWFRILWCLLALGLLATLPLMIIQFKAAHYSVHYQAWFIAGIFVLLAVPVTIYEVAMHLEYFSRPRLQIYVIRILWMVPIYAIDAWFSLRFKETRLYLNTVRECYEAYVIYNFFMYLLAYLHEEYGDVDAYFSTKEEVPHMWGLQYVLDPWPMGAEFFWKCKQGVLNYVILRPLMTAISGIAQLCGVYGDGSFRPDRVYVYTAVVNNCSQFWALYCLIIMYLGCHDELSPIRPLSKFIVVKSVVFFSYWQSVGISLLVALGIIRTKDWATYDVDDVAGGLQDFLICVEMFIAALAHAYAFPPRDYMDPSTPKSGFFQSLRVMFDVRDVVDDVQFVVDDTVQRTTDNVAAAGRTAWQTARRGGATALRRPRSLLQIFGSRQSRGRGLDYSDDEVSDGEGLNDNERALLSYSRSAKGSDARRAPHEALQPASGGDGKPSTL